MKTENTNPEMPDQDPDRDYEVRVLLYLRGYGKKQHRIQTVQSALKVLHIGFHDKSVRAFLLEDTEDRYGTLQGKEIFRDDRNA